MGRLGTASGHLVLTAALAVAAMPVAAAAAAALLVAFALGPALLALGVGLLTLHGRLLHRLTLRLFVRRLSNGLRLPWDLRLS